MPTYGNTARYALRKLLGSNLISDVDAGFAALADDVDAKFVGYSEGPFASRPVSTVPSPGIAGREYYATDTKRRYKDRGTSWAEISPAPPALLATWTGRFDSTNGAGDYPIAQDGSLATNAGPLILHTGALDYALEGRTSNLLLYATVAVNAVAPARTITAKLVQVTPNGSGTFGLAVGTAAITCPGIASPAAGSVSFTSSDAPLSGIAAGGLTALVNLSGAPAANSVLVVTLQLFREYT